MFCVVGTLPILITSIKTDSMLRANSKAKFWNLLEKQVIAASSDEKCEPPVDVFHLLIFML